MGRRTGFNDLSNSIGASSSVCLSCMMPYSTGKKYWHEMDAGDKIFVWIRFAFGTIMGGLYIGMFTGIGAYLLFKEENVLRGMSWGFLISGVLHYFEWKRLVEAGNKTITKDR